MGLTVNQQSIGHKAPNIRKCELDVEQELHETYIGMTVNCYYECEWLVHFSCLLGPVVPPLLPLFPVHIHTRRT